MSGKPNHMSDLRTAAAHPLASGTGEGHMIAAADARAIQGYGHDKDSGGGCDGMEEAVDGEGVEGDAPADHGDLGNPHALVVPPVASNQLTLSFHREVYVFDSVSPEKVIFCLLFSVYLQKEVSVLSGNELAYPIGSSCAFVARRSGDAD